MEAPKRPERISLLERAVFAIVILGGILATGKAVQEVLAPTFEKSEQPNPLPHE